MKRLGSSATRWPAGPTRSARRAALARGPRPAGASHRAVHAPARAGGAGYERARFRRSSRASTPPAGSSCARASVSEYTRDEMMTVAAARLLRDGQVCFVGIGLPSAACNLARLTHAPNLVLIYESGTIGTRPTVLPLSIGDGELAETATCVIPLPDIFSDYLQAGRIDVGFLGAAQIDKFGNLNSTVIGPYGKPKTRLPGAGGATEIAAHARQVFIVMKATPRSFVKALDFQTSGGHFAGRSQSGARGSGPAVHRHRRRHLETARGNRRIRAFRAVSRNPGRGSESRRRLAARRAAGARNLRGRRPRPSSRHCARSRPGPPPRTVNL